tara:strand:- start:165 stop:398 length:234 start_codon:yes stop_codon:yes gene_type:complete
VKGYKDKMYKILILAITVGGFVFAGSWDNTSKSIEKSDSVKNQFCMAEDTSKDDFKLERRKRGKGNKKRRRGGSGLR